MVNYSEFKFVKGEKYYIAPLCVIKEEIIPRWSRTCRNLNSLQIEGRPITIIIPERVMNSEELEEYRKYFCTKAKEDRTNYVYFPFPVLIQKKE